MSQKRLETSAGVEATIEATAQGQEKLKPALETGKDQEKTKKTLEILTACFDSWRSLRSLLEGASAETNFKDFVRVGYPSSRRPQNQEPAIQKEAEALKTKVQEAVDKLAKKITQLLSYSSLTPHLKESLPDLQIATPKDIETVLQELVKPVVNALRDEIYQQSHAIPEGAKSAYEKLEEAVWQASGQGAALTAEQTIVQKERRANFEKLVRSLQYLPGVHNNPEAEAVNNAYTSLLKGKGYGGENIRKLLDALQFYVVTETDKEMSRRIMMLEYNYTQEDLADLKRKIKDTGLINIDGLVSLPKNQAVADAGEFGVSGTEIGNKGGEKPEGKTAFEYNEVEAKRLGLERLELQGYPKADVLIQEFTGKIKPILESIESATDEDKKKPFEEQLEAEKTTFVESWQKDCPGLPMPCVPDKNDWWYLIQLAKDKIICSLTDDSKITLSEFGRAEIILTDFWQEENWDEKIPGSEDKKMQKINSPLLQEFLGANFTGVVNIKRKDLDSALWEGDTGDRAPSAKQKAVLEKLGLDSDQFEIRCIRQDEYSRGSVSQGWGQKNLWTNFDHYFLEGVGDRRGLVGGAREHGGASGVDRCWRAGADDVLAVRLVLSRKAV